MGCQELVPTWQLFFVFLSTLFFSVASPNASIWTPLNFSERCHRRKWKVNSFLLSPHSPEWWEMLDRITVKEEKRICGRRSSGHSGIWQQGCNAAKMKFIHSAGLIVSKRYLSTLETAPPTLKRSTSSTDSCFLAYPQFHYDESSWTYLDAQFMDRNCKW